MQGLERVTFWKGVEMDLNFNVTLSRLWAWCYPTDSVLPVSILGYCIISFIKLAHV